MSCKYDRPAGQWGPGGKMPGLGQPPIWGGLQYRCNASWEEALRLVQGGVNVFWVSSDMSIHSSSCRF